MADDDELKIHFEGKTYPFSDFEIGELEWLEEQCDAPIDEISMGSMKAAVMLITIIKRRENPQFSPDDARKMKLTVFDSADDESAPNGATKRPPRKSQRAKGSAAT